MLENLKLICLTVGELLKQVFSLPRTFSHSLRNKQHQAVANELEAERLDRLRNPSNYRGK